MARHTLGLYWNDMHIFACLAKATMSEVVVEDLQCFSRKLDDSGIPLNDISDDLQALKERMDLPIESSVVSLPERELMYRILTRPFSDRKKIAATIGPEMETLLPLLEDEMLVDFVLNGKNKEGETVIQTMAVRTAAVKPFITELKPLGMEPEIIDSPAAAIVAGARNFFDLLGDQHYVVLHMGWQETSVAFMKGERLKRVVALPFGFEQIAGSQDLLNEVQRNGIEVEATKLEPYLREILITIDRLGKQADEFAIIPTGYARSIANFESLITQSTDLRVRTPRIKDVEYSCSENELINAFMALSLAIRPVDDRDAVNFRQGDLAYTKKLELMKGQMGSFIRAGLAIALIWFMGVGIDLGVNARLNSKLDAQLKAAFSEAMPPGTPMVDPVVQLQQRLDQLSGGAGTDDAGAPLDVLRDISESIKSSVDVDLSAIMIDETSITLIGDTSNYDNVEKIKEFLDGLSYVSEVKIVSANVNKKDQRVKFKFALRKGNA